MSIAYLYQWAAVPSQSLTSDGTNAGLVTIPNTDGYYVGQAATLSASGQPSIKVQVVEVVSPTQMYVGAVGNFDPRYRANAIDISAYTVAATAAIVAAQQNKKLPTPNSIMQATHEAEPILAQRSMLVDGRGNPQFKVPTLQTLRASAVLTASYVATSALDISHANQVTVLTRLTKGNLSGAFLKFEVSDDNSEWFPVTVDNTTAATPSGDELQSQSLIDVKTLLPSTASATRYKHDIPVKGRYFRAQIVANGADPTNSLAQIQAYAGIS